MRTRWRRRIGNVCMAVLILLILLQIVISRSGTEGDATEPQVLTLDQLRDTYEGETGEEPEASTQRIRVLIKTSDFAALLHEYVTVTADTDYEICYQTEDGPQIQTHIHTRSAGESYTVEPADFTDAGDCIYIRPKEPTGRIYLQSVHRSQGIPAYRGHIELFPAEQAIAVVNELPVEAYLCAVVPSEMPATYGIEALKAQAVCARTYAYIHMQQTAYPSYGAHVDDSTTYQVYNNLAEQERTTEAVRETEGMLLVSAQSALAETFYYSTSCGVGSDATVWGAGPADSTDYLRAKLIRADAVQAADLYEADVTEQIEYADAVQEADLLREESAFRAYITRTDPAAFEAAEAWYRWTYSVEQLSCERLYQALSARYQADPQRILTRKGWRFVCAEPKPFQTVKRLYIASRGSGGVAEELILETDAGTYQISKEFNIRSILCDGFTEAERADGERVRMSSLLPSGFFVLDAIQKNQNVIGYKLTGGGFGHGVGMSQNAAKEMALKGYTCEEILQFFYDGCRLAQIYESVSRQ
ncbi:MAG: SpoIID/LytB domain-containing protein [Lachnospiraceae bacterium]|nr:SpoIID/LytB domain-containing protein [Lachnospiraceae bacterium]